MGEQNPRAFDALYYPLKVLRALRRLTGRTLSSLGLVALLATAGCAATPVNPTNPSEQAPLLPRQQVASPDYATAVHSLLRDGAMTPERSAVLAGVVNRQLQHAGVLFERGEDVRGTNAVVGAFYLLRIGEVRADMLDESSVTALRGALERFSARGDEGRALALMLMLRGVLPPGSQPRQELEMHMQALERWIGDTRSGGEIQQLAAAERAAVGRSLIDPREENMTAAAEAINAWIARAVEYNLRYQESRVLPPREEVAEAYRALQVGGETMAALFLRHGRADRALQYLSESEARRVTSPAFFARVRAAAVDDTAEDWRLLARDFARLSYGEGELQIDRALVDAALWGIALEAYRRDPQSLAIGHLLADQLITLELPEAAPLVLADALGPDPTVVSLSAVMATVADALSNQYESGSLDSARRIFAASDRLLVLADQPARARQLRPSASQLRQLMAGIELRSGDIDAARPLLSKALESEPTVWGYTMLATLERQAGNLDAALTYAQKATDLPTAAQLPLDAAEARFVTFEVERERGHNEAAAAALEEALQIALANRTRGDAASKVRAERLLARALDGYNEDRRAQRALDRALDIANDHRHVLGSTVLSAVGRALVHKNVGAARTAVQLGIKADLEREHMVYAAIWLMFLERELAEAPDGKVDRVLGEAVAAEDWTGNLARWARDMLTDAELRSAATNYAERVEAEFYITMRARIEGQAGAREKLEEVARNPLIDLMEVQIARELLAPKLPATLPPKYSVP